MKKFSDTLAPPSPFDFSELSLHDQSQLMIDLIREEHDPKKLRMFYSVADQAYRTWDVKEALLNNDYTPADVIDSISLLPYFTLDAVAHPNISTGRLQQLADKNFSLQWHSGEVHSETLESAARDALNLRGL